MKAFCARIVVFLMLVCFCGCSPNAETTHTNNKGTDVNQINRKIEYVTVNDKKYCSYYLYHCSNITRVDDDFELKEEEQTHFNELTNKTLYCLDDCNYGIGDKIQAYLTDCYGKDEFSAQRTSVYDHVIESYPNDKVEVDIVGCDEYDVSVYDNGDTYVITFYTVNNSYLVGSNPECHRYRLYASLNTDKELLMGVIEKHIIETVKSNVVIYYES